jgi:integrase/recombinase XerD
VGELCALEVSTLPDFVFVNLFEGEVGRLMTYAAVMSLVKRLANRTGARFTAHMLRHSRATIWICDDELPLPVVSLLLTHTSIQTTNDIYLQLSPAAQYMGSPYDPEAYHSKKRSTSLQWAIRSI